MCRGVRLGHSRAVMSATIHVDLASPCVGEELAEYLCTYGLAATVLATDDHCELEISDAVDPDVRLHQTFEDALRGWLADRNLPLVPIESLHDCYVLRPPCD